MLIKLCDICEEKTREGGFATIKFTSHHEIREYYPFSMHTREIDKPNSQYCICKDCRCYLTNMKENAAKIKKYDDLTEELINIKKDSEWANSRLRDYDAIEEERRSNLKNKTLWQRIFNKQENK